MASINDFLSRQFPDRTSQNLTSVEIEGFQTLVRVTENVRRTATTTFSYVEDGSFVSDHIISDPIVISISGNVSDIHVVGDPVAKFLGSVQDDISDINQFLPSRTQTQLTKISAIANDIADAESRILNAAQRNPKIFDAIGLSDIASNRLKDLGVGKNQERFIDVINAKMDNQKRGSNFNLSTIKIGPKEYNNLVITNFEFALDNKEDSLDFSIEFTEVREASSVVENSTDQANPVKAAADSAKEAVEGEIDKGSSAPTEIEDQSILRGFLRGVAGFFG